MNPFVSIFFIVLIIFFFIDNNYSGLLFIVVLSLIGNMFFINFFGSRIILFQAITLLFIPFLLKNRMRFVSKMIFGIKMEYILLVGLGVLYGLIIPWHYSSGRAWNQQASGRALVALVSILSELLLIYFTYYVFKYNKVSLKKFLNILSVLIIITSIVAFLDFFLNYPIFKFLFINKDLRVILQTRLLGFSHEPRSLGRLLTIGWMCLFLFRINGYKFIFSTISLLFGFLTILFSLSFSTYFIFLLSLAIIFISNRFRKKISLLIVLVTLFLGFHLIAKTNYFKTGIMLRYVLVTEGKKNFVMPGEPIFFTRFEVYDRAALNFFYNDPYYLLFGTGPNLISIPSSKYLGPSAVHTFHGKINGIPGFGIINLVSRSGLIGLFLYLTVFVKINKLLNKEKTKVLHDLFVVVSITFLFVRSPWLYFIIGFVIAQYEIFIYKNQLYA